MGELSEKELSCINESLSEEELLVKKFKLLADTATDAKVKAKLDDISNKTSGTLQLNLFLIRLGGQTWHRTLPKKKF